MGCDIAIYFEEKDYTGKWKEVEVKPNNILPDSRYYQVWAFLFNVRNDDEWGYKNFPFERRGLPEDCSIPGLKEQYEDDYGDWHSHTYLTADEVENIQWPDDLKDCYFKIFLEYIFPAISTTYEKLENHRMTVCFHS